MPLTSKGEDILASMKKEYGVQKGEQIFYASKNAGTISGVDSSELDCALDTMAVQIGSLGEAAAGIVKKMDEKARRAAAENKWKPGDKLKDGGKVVSVSGDKVRVWYKGWKPNEWTEVHYKTLNKDEGRFGSLGEAAAGIVKKMDAKARGDAYKLSFKVKWEARGKSGTVSVMAEGPKEALHEAQKELEKQGYKDYELYMSASYE